MNLKQLVKKFVPQSLIKIYHYSLAFCGAIIYGFPSKNLIVIGVTGTSGKSTTVDFITRILEEPFDTAQGKHGDKVASLSSIRFKIGSKEWKNELKMTMPGRFTIQKFLRDSVKEKCKYAVLEVTSEGIKQFRHKFINFDTAVFNNLSPEHIESHGSFEKYRNEKLKLFSAGGGSAFGGKIKQNKHIVNLDDENAKYFLEIPAKKVVTFGINNGQIKAENVSGNSFTVNGEKINLNLLGKFNIYNALAGISVGLSYNIPLEVCKKAIEKVKTMPGRMEIVNVKPLVIVDYAHTPEQLEQAYKSFDGKNLVCVLGSCGGGRDKWKRPVLGKIASEYCKEIIITNEDPYDEDPLEIMEQVASGIENYEHSIVLDRREAIKKAISLANLEDVVIITGKGSENLMCLANGVKIPWSDREIAKEALKK